MSAPRFAARNLLPLAVSTFYALAFTYVALRVGIPSDGARLTFQSHPEFPNSVLVSPVQTQPDGLQTGDYVIRVDGQDISQWSLNVFIGSSRPHWAFEQTVNYTVVRGVTMLNLPVILGTFPIGAVIWDNAFILLFLLVLQTESIWIWRQRRDQRAPQILLLAVSSFCAFSLCWYIGTDVPTLVNVPWLIVCYRLLTFTMLMIMCAAILHFALIVPRHAAQPPLPSQVVAGIYLTPFLVYPLFMAMMYHPTPAEWLRRWEIGMISLIFAAFILALVAMLYGYHRLRHRVPRLHVRLIAIAFAFATVLAVLYWGIPIFLSGQSIMGWNVLPLLSLPVALGLGIAVVFYRLFDIRVVIQRTLVWGSLTTLIISTYVLVVGGLGILFQQGDSLFSLIATGMVAVMFHGVRTRLQTRVSSLLYGDVDQPYEVVKRITQQIEAAAPDEAFSQFVHTVGTALKLPYCAIELGHAGQYQPAAAWGLPNAEYIEFPLTFHAEQVGRIIVCPRAAGETLTAGDQELLRGVVDQAEVVIEMARLNSALQASREKLVLAREEERRRLRRDLHDGLGPALASLALQLDAARNLLVRDPEQTQAILSDLKAQVKSAVMDVRRLVDELRPPALDELGLVGAIREKARQFELDGTLSITIEAPTTLPPLPAALEVAAYRIITEAMTNVVRHAGATTCVVRLTLNGMISITVQDNGRGLPHSVRSGVGIRSMSERAAELGGTCILDSSPDSGTLVCARLPYTSVELTP